MLAEQLAVGYVAVLAWQHTLAGSFAAVLAEQLAVGYVAVLATDSAAVLAWQHNLADSFAAVLAEQLAVGYVAVLAWQHFLSDLVGSFDFAAELDLLTGFAGDFLHDFAHLFIKLCMQCLTTEVNLRVVLLPVLLMMIASAIKGNFCIPETYCASLRTAATIDLSH